MKAAGFVDRMVWTLAMSLLFSSLLAAFCRATHVLGLLWIEVLAASVVLAFWLAPKTLQISEARTKLNKKLKAPTPWHYLLGIVAFAGIFVSSSYGFDGLQMTAFHETLPPQPALTVAARAFGIPIMLFLFLPWVLGQFQADQSSDEKST